MKIFEILNELTQKYPFVYNCVVIVLAFIVSAVADFAVKKILLRGLQKIYLNFSDNDDEERSLVLKLASRLANVVPTVILYGVPGYCSS